MVVLWNPDKSRDLLKDRNVSFEMVFEKILSNDFLGPQLNPSRKGQYRIIVEINDYPHVVPLVIDEEGNWFLKTIYPSRKEKRRQENEK